MSETPRATFASTKLIVHDLEGMARFYCSAYGFEQTGRIQAAIGSEPIDEIFLGVEGGTGASLILMKYVERPAPVCGAVCLVFTTDDVEALVGRVRAAGGAVDVAPYQSDVTPYRAGFTTDPEGNRIENVEIPS